MAIELSPLQKRVFAAAIYFPLLLLSTFDSTAFSFGMSLLLAVGWHEYLLFRTHPAQLSDWVNHFLKVLMGTLPVLLLMVGHPISLGFALVAFSVQAAVIGSLIESGSYRALIDRLGFYVMGLLYLTGLFSLLALIQREKNGTVAVQYLFLVVAATDTGAYFAGRKWGKIPFFQHISPKKTQEGFMGGLISAVAVGLALHFLLKSPADEMPKIWAMVLLSVIVAVVSAFGDLFESLLKRHYGVKDSGTLIPGHGGVLDRFDGVLFAALPVYFFIVIRGGFR